MGSYIKKHGLLYSSDMHTVLGVDDTSNEFTGRIPFGAHRIDDDVFSDCPYESLSLPDSVTELGNHVFENSKALEKVKLSSALTSLPPYLFAGCSALTKVTMPNQLEAFPEGLFKNCESLPEIPFRAGLKTLSASVFEGCASLKSLVIPNTVTRIESRAAAGCTSLESIVFPAGLEFIAEDAFEACTSIHNIRIDGESNQFYVGEDGGLYEVGDGDKLVVKAYGVQAQTVSFFKDNADELSAGLAEDADDDIEDDDTFSAEIGASEEESEIMEMTEKSEAEPQKPEIIESSLETEPAPAAELPVDNSPEPVFDTKTEDKGDSQNMEDNTVDSMLADIMGEEKERSAVSEDVAVSAQETEILSETLDVMADSTQGSEVAVTNDELEKLFAKNEEDELATHNADNPEVLDSKAQILTDSVTLSHIIECQPAGQMPEENELYVIAEKLIPGEDGKDFFTSKLITCCKTLARIHDFKKIVLLYGLPVDNDEFTLFFKHFISKKNVILACEAETPSKLSDYGKKICELARISLKSEDLAEQRNSASIKTESLIKLVIRDKYE